MNKFIEDSILLYKKFHWGNGPKYLDKIKIKTREIPKVLVKLGELEAVIYKAKKGDKRDKYIHKFKKVKPILTTDRKGSRLYIIGGNYKVDEDGIID